MKKIITLFILFVATQIFAQNNGISYQAIILNPKGEQLPGVNNSTSPLANKNICMVFKFVDEFSNIEYQETIQTKTDGFGMVNLVIGSGNQTAGYAASFKDIVWNISKKSLSVGINTDGSCSNFTEISNQEFSYVPLAFSAVNAENVTGVVAIENGGTNATTLLGAKTNLEINNVDNTSDLNKPISTATQTALSLKEVLSNKSTDLATDGDSDTKYPSVKSVKMYVDGKLLTSSNALIAEITRATAAENTIAADLATETTNRTSADAILTTNLTAEVTRATTAENTITADLATEITNRTSVDATLTSNLAAEVTRATAAENTIAADLVTETTNRIAADATLTTNLATEVTRATAAENAIVADLTTETTNRTSADAILTTNLTAEVTRATAAENTIAADLVTETTNRIAADATLTTNLATEVTRATAAENTIATDLVTETTARASADATLISNLAAEVTRAKAAENTIAADLVTETTNRTSADATLTTNLTAEVTRATTAENTITADLATEITNRTSVDATLTTNLAAEVARATTVENTIAADLVTETSNRINADETLTTNLATEVTNRTNADLLKEDLANKSTDVTADGTSDTKYPTVKSVKTYVDANGTIASTALTNEINRATAAEGTLTANLAAEASTARAAELANATAIVTETTNRTNADATLTASLATEVDRATDAEDAIAANLLTETTNRTSADATLQTNINSVQADVDANELATNNALALKAPLASPTFTGTVSGIDKMMVGLGNVDDTSDLDKPISNATQTALDLKADLFSPTFTGVPLAPTADSGTTSTQIATTKFVSNAISTLSVPYTGATGPVDLGIYDLKINGTSFGTNGRLGNIGIGINAGSNTQGSNAVAIGNETAMNTQGSNAVAIGAYTAGITQGSNAVAVGNQVAYTNQGASAIAIGNETASINQGENAIAIGSSTGYNNQGSYALAVGGSAGNNNQGSYAIAVGVNSGNNIQGSNAIAIGNETGNENQGSHAVAVGNMAGKTNQGSTAISIGSNAGRDNQGENSIAIGSNAGKNNQNSNSIILNATGADLDTTTSGFFVDPIRNVSSSNALFYNTATKEITYESLPSVSLTSGVNDILPVSNGGSGVNTSTGTGSLVLSASPTFTGTVSGIDKTMIGLSNADDTSDLNKPISTATQTALDLKAPIESPTFTGTPSLPTGTIGVTQTAGNNTTALATTAFVTSANATNANLTGMVTSVGNATTVVTNANLTGPITSSGNATSVASQTGTGSKFVMDTAPTLVTPVLGVATATSVNGTSIPTSKTLVVTTDKLSALSATTSAELAGVISDETGTGSVVLSASPTFTGTVSGIDKTMIGLSNADDTSDLNKPISTATQTALNLKANLASPTFTGTVSGIDKTMVGLGNVDNISDANKPVSAATQTA